LNFFTFVVPCCSKPGGGHRARHKGREFRARARGGPTYVDFFFYPQVPPSALGLARSSWSWRSDLWIGQFRTILDFLW